ncbi:pyridoxine 5'-phosphate synthase [Thermospira aquatica]|uniref:Pyridoxine 5'-phosphate synthase n=1 Tax=Thermospira aquatica TaxID=2828656 RepID=A0AAX3BEF2_9SPIR|nr:pyridoxine 5'-phosphate synthase [Thermospira aquatica]URA10434.1 pyridoxine 5'-phosphate synthase [Thermospira aquatica]
MLYLGVNIDHVATLRQIRLAAYPDPVAIAPLVEKAGAHGITVHLREDRRHIQEHDVRRLRQSVTTRLNLELALSEDIIRIALEVRPDEVCLVPEKRQELTTEGGLDVLSQEKDITAIVKRFHEAGIKTSLFIDADPSQIEAAKRTKTDMIELHTGRYAEANDRTQDIEFERLREGAKVAASLGLQVNAGHGLNYDNTARIAAIPELHTLNIGHAIVARALFVGIEQAVREMLEVMHHGRKGQEPYHV